MLAELMLLALGWQAPQPVPEIPAALRPYQGTWQLVAVLRPDGKREPLPKGCAFMSELAIKGDKVQTLEMGTPIGGWCTLAPDGTAITSPSPYAASEPETQGQDTKVTCTLKDGVLTVREVAGKKRLSYLTVPTGNLEFRLEKSDDADVKKYNRELAKFAGEWDIVYSGEAAKAPKEGTEKITKETKRLAFRDRQVYFVVEGKVVERSVRALWISPDGANRVLSFGTNCDPFGARDVLVGTYEFKGDTLTIRHSRVTLRPENEEFVIRLRRVSRP